jgi:hypothetical protein
MKVYLGIFYSYFKFFSLIKGNDIPEWSALFMYSIMQGSNLICIITFFERNKFLGDFETSRIHGMIIVAIIIFVNYYFLVRNQKIKINKESDEQYYLFYFPTLIYTIISIIFVFNLKK